MSKSTIIKLRQTDASFVQQNGSFKTTLSQPISIEKGDVVQLKNAFLDTSTDVIKLDNDTDNVNDTVTERESKPLPFKSEDQLRIEKLFGKRVATPMDKAELSAWESAKGIVDDMTEREWTDLEDFYAAPQEKTYARKSLATLLNNLSGELDKAANWSQQHTNAQRKLSTPTIWN